MHLPEISAPVCKSLLPPALRARRWNCLLKSQALFCFFGIYHLWLNEARIIKMSLLYKAAFLQDRLLHEELWVSALSALQRGFYQPCWCSALPRWHTRGRRWHLGAGICCTGVRLGLGENLQEAAFGRAAPSPSWQSWCAPGSSSNLPETSQKVKLQNTWRNFFPCWPGGFSHLNNC